MNNKKEMTVAGQMCWCMPVIPAIWVDEIRRIIAQFKAIQA
jgi:hypothetical protein